MTETEVQEWQQRLRAAVEQTLRRRAAKAEFSAQHAEARAHGLTARHARKLGRAARQAHRQPPPEQP